MVCNFNFQSNKQKYILDSSLDLKLYPTLEKRTQKGICRSLTPRCEYENTKASLVQWPTAVNFYIWLRFYVHMVVTMKTAAFSSLVDTVPVLRWDVLPYSCVFRMWHFSLVNGYKHVGGTMLPPKSGMSLMMEVEIPPKHWYPTKRLPWVTTQTRLNTLKLIITMQKFHKIRTVFSHFSKC